MPIAAAFFVSGAAALVLQVLWTRMLGHVLGADALAVSTVLTVFMGGLALGSHLGGRHAPRLRRPLLAFAGLEAAVGLYGLFVPAGLDAMVAVQAGVVEHLGDGRWGPALLRFALAGLLLLPPTTLMGATLPLLAQALVRRSERLAERIGGLYAANTFGAVAGALLAGFFLIPELGVTATVRIAAALDLSVAAAVLAFFSVGRVDALVKSRPSPLSPTARLRLLEPTARIEPTEAERRRVLFAFALSGAAAMALEVLLTRAIGVVIGASTYAFTAILVSFLVGLAGGAAVMSRRVTGLAHPLAALSRAIIAAGIATLLVLFVVDALPLLMHSVARVPGLRHEGLHAAQLGLSLLVALPATLVLGTIFPLVLACLSAGSEPGPLVGRAYALNTVGGIVGSFAGGFVLLPMLGVERGLAGCGLGLALIGVWVMKDRLRPASLELSALVVAVAIVLFRPQWDIERWTAGMFRFHLAKEAYADGWVPSLDLLYHRDGVATTVTVGRSRHRTDGLGVLLKVNGKVDASDVGDMPTQILSGLLPLLVHPTAKDALVIGYGSGVTPGALLRAPLERLFVAELESAIYEASNRYFKHVNHEPFADPRARLVVDDGRNFLLTRNIDFDVIVSEPSNPWMSGAASLFTLDFFEIAKRRLREDGVFLQWLQLYELSEESIHTLARTFAAAFPHVLVMTPDGRSNDTFLIGSRRPLVFDRETVAAALSDPRVGPELVRAGVEDPDDLLGLFHADRPRLSALVGPGPLNTDDNAWIEFRAPRDLLDYATRDAQVRFREDAEGRRRALLKSGPFRGYSSDPVALLGRGLRLARQGRLADARDHAKAAQKDDPEAQRLLLALGAAVGPDDEPILNPDDVVRGHRAYAEVAVSMIEGRDREALTLALADGADERWETSPAHRLMLAYLYYREDRSEEAERLFSSLLSSQEDPSAALLYYAGRNSADRGLWPEAMRRLLRFAEKKAKGSD